jgi:hypothetical protein
MSKETWYTGKRDLVVSKEVARFEDAWIARGEVFSLQIIF